MTKPSRFLVACHVTNGTKQVSTRTIFDALIKRELAGDANKDVRTTVVVERDVLRVGVSLLHVFISVPISQMWPQLLGNQRAQQIRQLSHRRQLGQSHVVICSGSVAYCEKFLDLMASSLSSLSGWVVKFKPHVKGASEDAVYWMDAQNPTEIKNASFADLNGKEPTESG